MTICCLVGWSGSGKTNCIIRLIRTLTERGFSVGAIKHTHHEIALDTPGKDSDQYAKAGAEEICLSSPAGNIFFKPPEPFTKELIERYFPNSDFVLCEGVLLNRALCIETAYTGNSLNKLKYAEKRKLPILTDSRALIVEAEKAGIPVYPYKDLSKLIATLEEEYGKRSGVNG